MSYDVHLCIIGDSPDPVFGILRSDRQVDRIYLLCDDDPNHKDVLETLFSGLSAVGIGDVTDIQIDPEDYDYTQSVIASILEDERRSHDDVQFHVNFSSGDSLSVIALRQAVEPYDSDYYYIRNGRAVRIGGDSVTDVTSLRIQTKVLDTFMMFKSSDSRTNSELRGDLSAPALSYRTRELERMGLIISEGSNRNLSWKVTSKGKQVLRRFR